jgi:hypothetical protein
VSIFLFSYLLLTAVLVLDPRISYETLQEEYAADDELLAHLKTAKAELQSEFSLFYAPATPSVTATPSLGSMSGSPQKVDFTGCLKRQILGTKSDELAEYFRITSVPEPFEGVDPLQCWYSCRWQFPNLYRLFRNILCIPGIFFLS